MRSRLKLSTAMCGVAIMLTWQAALAFDIATHLAMTRNVLLAASATLTSGEIVTFSEEAIQEVEEANEAVDSVASGSAALFHPERHFTNEAFTASSQRLIDHRTMILAALKADPPDGRKARILFGQALHTLQDFYSHSNWVELGNAGINAAFGTSTLANPAAALQPCASDANVLGTGGGGGLTSGYFVGLLDAGCGALPHPGKCYHGNYTESCVGINKDRDVPPGNANYATASAIAEQATQAYLELIMAGIDGDDEAIIAFFDVKGTVGFVIDDTGSMGPEISGVKLVVNAIVLFLDQFPFTRPTNWLLERFGDPSVGPPFLTTDAGELLGALSALTASGGGDCPEFAQSALLEAADSALPNSRLFFFSDASSKDPEKTNAAIAKAQEKSTTLTYLLTGSCSPVDEAYVRGAEETGGQLFFLNTSELPLVFQLIEPQLNGDFETIRSSKGTLSGGTAGMDFPVDSTVTRLVISVSIDFKTSVVVRRPSGTAVSASDPEVTIADLSTGCIVSIASPEAGTWSVEIEGFGSYSVISAGNSGLQFSRFDFVELTGDLHGGFAPITGQPLVDSTVMGEATILGPFSDGEFRLVRPDGVEIAPIALAQNFPGAPAERFLGTFDVPSGPYRVVASGMDPLGFAYRREYSSVYRGQSLGIEVSGGTSTELPPGSTTVFHMEVTNHGDPGSFLAQAAPSAGFGATVSPTSLNLDTGESALLSVIVTVPPSTKSGVDFSVTVTATKVGDATVFNSAILNLSVVSNSPPDCTTASGVHIVLWPPNHKLTFIDVLQVTGITDPDGDPLTVMIDAITQDESVSGGGFGQSAPDGAGLGSGVAQIRAERAGNSNGRVYEVFFTVMDDRGASCQGTFRVSVPHDKNSTAVDDGQVFDSTVP